MLVEGARIARNHARMRFSRAQSALLITTLRCAAALAACLILLAGPLVGSYLISRLLSAPNLNLLTYLRPATTLLRLDWAYGVLEQGALIGRRLTRHVTHMIQEPFYLGWVLAWALLIVLYFAER